MKKNILITQLLLTVLFSTNAYASNKGALGSCNGYAENCQNGWLLNHDGTCSENKISGKTPIGIIFYIDDLYSGKCGYAISVEPAAKGIAWTSPYNGGNKGGAVSANSSTVYDNMASCTHTKRIISTGDKSLYPAAWTAKDYAPVAAQVTKGKWCLPAGGVLARVSLDLVNNALKKINSQNKFGENPVWSSTPSEEKGLIWVLCSYSNSCDNPLAKANDFIAGPDVWPVITF